MWQFYNPNPHGNRVIDCTVRALCKALDTDWDTAYCMIAAETYDATAWDDTPVMTAILAAVIWEKNCAA